MEKHLHQEDAPMKLIFNYNNIFYSFFYDDIGACHHRCREYALNYVLSGEMLLDNGKEKVHVRKGECAFIPRDHHITMYKKSYGGGRYCGIFLMFTREFLREMFTKLSLEARRRDTPKLDSRVLVLPKTVELESFFSSMTPYFNRDIVPKEDFMKLKLQEGLMALLAIDERFVPTMFDFADPWKIDILDFMEKNFMCEFTIEEIAHYTGRSLATFKRDFRKVSDLSPEKWLIRRRLQKAYELLSSGKRKVVDVYAEVGFKNPSHFSTSFKRHFGIAPSEVGD